MAVERGSIDLSWLLGGGCTGSLFSCTRRDFCGSTSTIAFGKDCPGLADFLRGGVIFTLA